MVLGLTTALKGQLLAIESPFPRARAADREPLARLAQLAASREREGTAPKEESFSCE